MCDISWFVLALGWLKPPAAHRWANAGTATPPVCMCVHRVRNRLGRSVPYRALFRKRMPRFQVVVGAHEVKFLVISMSRPQIHCLRHKMIRRSMVFVVLSLVAEAVAGLQAFSSLLWMMGWLSILHARGCVWSTVFGLCIGKNLSQYTN